MNTVALREQLAGSGGLISTGDVDPISQMIYVIDRVSRDPSVPIERIQTMLEMFERLYREKARREYHTAMKAAQAEMQPVVRDLPNKQTNSDYASLAAIDTAIRPIYTSHGFGMSFDTADCPLELHVRSVCDVTHDGGHMRQHHLDIPCDGKGARGNDVMSKTHATMSAVTYGRRGLYGMIWNIATGGKAFAIVDDDGNMAGRIPNGNGGGKISSEQLKALIELCDKVDQDKEQLCKFMKIEGLALLEASRFKAAWDLVASKAQFNKARDAVIGAKQ